MLVTHRSRSEVRGRSHRVNVFLSSS